MLQMYSEEQSLEELHPSLLPAHLPTSLPCLTAHPYQVKSLPSILILPKH